MAGGVDAHRPPSTNARITLLARALNNLALAVVVAGFVAPAAKGQLHGGMAGRDRRSLGSASEPPYMSAGNSCSGGCGNDLGSSVGWLIWPGDPHRHHLRRAASGPRDACRDGGP